MAKEKEDKALEKEKAFVEIYISNGRNGKRAYMKAYGTENEGTAGVEASRLLKKPRVLEYMKKIAQPTAEKRIATAQDVLVFLTAAMNGEIKDQFGLDASLSDREKAAELLGKTHSMFTDKVKVTGNINMAEVLKAARNRAKKVKEQEQEHGKE